MNINTLKIICSNCGKETDAYEKVAFARYQCTYCDTVNEVLDFTIQEWLGFNYIDYLQAIITEVKEYPFPYLKAESKIEELHGKLSEKQIEELRKALINTFEGGKSIRFLSNEIKEKVKPGDLDVYDADGNYLYSIPETQRNISIARTESTNTANLGTEKYYKEQNVEQYSWIASNNACPLCQELNGRIFPIGQGPLPAKHPLCRCSIGAVTKIKR